MAADRKADRHRNRWHTQVRDIPPEVWARIKAGASARYVETNGRGPRPLNVGEYITRSVLVVEQVRQAMEEADSTDEFYRRVQTAMEELGMEAVRA